MSGVIPIEQESRIVPRSTVETIGEIRGAPAVVAEVPFPHVCSPIIFVVYQLSETVEPPIERDAVSRASVDMRPRSSHERRA
jgi:hypothetical protein